MNRYASRILSLGLVVMTILSLGYKVQYQATAAPIMTIAPLTWDVIGLDSNDELTGPDKFPIGARVCNTGSDPAANLTATFVFDDGEDLFNGDLYINLRDGSLSEITLASLAAGTPLDPTCTDFYFEAEVTRDSDAYDNTRRYHIDVTADGGISLSTPRPRELFVEYLISQSRNSTDDIKLGIVSIPAGGTMTLTVGSTYEIHLLGSTATNGYEQIETFLHLPNTIFQVLSVSTTYGTNNSVHVDNPNDKLYADGCLWEADPNSPNYRSCLDVGKNGNDIVVTYQVKVIAGAGTSETINSLIYDFSGSSYHYNADFSSTARIVNIVGPSSIAIQKQFVPDRIIPTEISTMTITITNPTTSTISGVNFTDPLPTAPEAMVVAADPASSTTGCGSSPTFSPSASTDSISFSNGTLAPNSSCVIKVDVTVPIAGAYPNTTDLLYINGDESTGNTASDTLTAAAAVSCTPDTFMARWAILSGTTENPPDLAGGLPTDQSARVSTAAASVFIPVQSEISTTVGGAFPPGDDTVWTSYGYKNDGQYYDFVVDTRHFNDVVMTFYEQVDSNGPTSLTVSYDNGSGMSPKVTYAAPTIGSFGLRSVTFTPSETSGSGNTTFRVSGTGANNDQQGANLHLDYITFTGCAETDPPPALIKAFSPAAIPQNTSSTLTFTLSNTNPSAVDISGVTFTDTLPPGLEVAASPDASMTCSGLPTWEPGPGDTTLVFGSPDGATMTADTSCTAQVDVTATSAGIFENVSGYISSNESGENTGSDGYATATLTAIAPPIISKLFETSPILTNTSTTLSFTITNPNQSSTLSGIEFTDDLPAGVEVENGSSTPCGGSLTTTNPSSISFSGGWLAAASSCTFSVTVAGATAGTKVNVTSLVNSTEGDSGNSASDTLIVRDPTPAISVLKQISTDPGGPWMSSIGVATGTNVHFRFILENTGDVPLSPISITDDTLDVSACNAGWSATTLPVAVAANDNHIVTCTAGPIAAAEGSHTNTASASGTYDGSSYDSPDPPATATYATTGLTMVKSVQESYFSELGDQLTYSYLVTNSGYASLAGPVVITDDKATEPSCPDVDSVGDLDAFFERGETITCSATYNVQAGDMAAGFVTNLAFATVDGVESPDDSETVPLKPLVDLIVEKTDGVNQYIPGDSLTYVVVVSNAGANPAIDAGFSDPRPPGISSWSWSCASTGSASCGATTSGTGDISVSDIDLPTEAVNNYLTYTINATVDAGKSDELINTATVSAPAANVESNPDDNSATDTDTLTPPVNLGVTKTDGVTEYLPGGSLTYTIVVSNSGPNIATNAAFVDSRPAGISSWSWSCAATGSANCGATASGTGDISVNDVDLPPDPISNHLTYTINATVAAGWSANLTNTATVSAPSGTYDTDGEDNSASDTDTLQPIPELTLTKSGILDNSVVAPSDQSNPGDTITYSFLLENTGNVTLNTIIVTDPLLPTLDCELTSLAPSASANCTATNNVYSLTQADIDAGQVDNTASADSDETAPTTDPASVSLAQAPALTILKSVSEDSSTWVDKIWVDVVDTVYFRVRVANSGNVTLTGLVVDDGMAGCALTRGSDVSGDDDDDFEVGEEWQYTCSLAASAGTQTNIATADTAQTGEATDDAAYVGGNIYDPPFGVKTVNEAGTQVLQWTMIWINDSNDTALGASVSDPIPLGTTYDPSGAPSGYAVPGGAPAGSVNTGVACMDSSAITTTTACYFEGPSGLYPRGRIVWEGSLGPDPGAANAAQADHEIVITFRMLVDSGILDVQNFASLDADLNGDGDFDDPGETPGANAEASWQGDAATLPATGFAPDRVSPLTIDQPASIAAAGELTLEIPRLGIHIPILQIPSSGSSWDISWLWDQAGLLEGTAYPGWPGNSVMAAHLYLPSGDPGPFADLGDLRWGDEIIVHAHGLRHIYEVRSRDYVLPDDISVLGPEAYPWLTLITCHDYDEAQEAYSFRLVVRAVKTSIEGE